MSSGTNPEVWNWSTRLAREVDETLGTSEEPLAPLIAAAYLEGGERRRELFQPAEGTVGAFGAGGMEAVLPTVLQSVAMLGPVLLGLITSPQVSQVLLAVNNTLSLALAGTKMKESREPKADASAAPPSASQPVGADLESIQRVTEHLERELQRCGVAAEKRELISLRLFKALLEDAQGTAAFLNQVSHQS